MRTGTKAWLMIAASLVLIGCILFAGVMTMLKWDFTKISTAKYENNHYEITESFNDISIVTNTADIILVPSENEKASVVCHEQKNRKHSVTVEDGKLVIEIVDARKWYEYIGVNFDTPKITVSIPQDEYGLLFVKSGTGNIRIENVSANTLDLSVATGGITVSDVTCEGDVKINVSTGKTNLTDIRCKNIVSRGNTGDIYLKNVVAAEKLSVERSTGDVKFDGSDAAEVFVKTDTGDVTGSLLTDKVFITQTGTGDVNVPKTVNGGRCEITTATGEINMSIKQ